MVAEIKIQRRHRFAWWPWLLLVLLPLAWYLVTARRRAASQAGLVRDTATPPPMAPPLPSSPRTP
jgi:hypothetical protein